MPPLPRAAERAYLTLVTAPSRPLAGLTFTLVGPGRVGASLAARLVAHGARLAAVAGRPASPRAGALAARFAARLGTVETLETRGEALLLLAVPDAALAPLASALAARRQAAVALHVAGALGARAVAPLAAAGSAIGTFHPLRAFPEADLAEAGTPLGGFVALGGDPEAIALGRRLAAALGASAEVIPDPLRLLYHLTATLFAGGVATVVAAAREIAARAGLPEATSAGYTELARGALASAFVAVPPASGITGPAARGDRETFAAELAALATLDPESVPAVVALARESLRQVALNSPLTPAQEALRLALAGADLLDQPKDRVLTSDGSGAE